MDLPLPIESIRQELLAALENGPVVVTSPTGSGKSTQVPRWCPGKTLVVEPRRVACRSLAQRVAELEASALGEEVGYWVRDERRATSSTRILFATPGVVLRTLDQTSSFDTVILDEFHERGLETDLLLALLLQRFAGHLAIMSATMDAEHVALHLEGCHLHAPGTAFPVEVRYLPEGVLLPESRGLDQRVCRALDTAAGDQGDVLVFLPGKGEIAACRQALGGRPDTVVLELHGGLSLSEQSRVFSAANRRKVILATNVAETSLTVPGVTTVIDSGLVRQTRYRYDRGYLTLSPIARDSAEQRRGRAGRTAPGQCLRLWSEAARLEDSTRPEIHRESLVPLVLATAACGELVEELPFLESPADHAVARARHELEGLGALTRDGGITEAGRLLYGLPLDAHLGRLLVEARTRDPEVPGLLEDMVDLVSALAPGRADLAALRRAAWIAGTETRAPTCDAVGLIRGLRRLIAEEPLHSPYLREAARSRSRLRESLGVTTTSHWDAAVDRRRLALAILAANPALAHVARRRGKGTAWSNGGKEVELARESFVAERDDVEALAVLETRALGLKGRDTRILVSSAMPLRLSWLEETGLGRDRLSGVVLKEGRLQVRVERVYARKTIAVREESPVGHLAREAVARLFLEGRLFKKTLPITRNRLEEAAMARDLEARGLASWPPGTSQTTRGKPLGPREWVMARLEEIGLESGDDLELLAPRDLLPRKLPEVVTRELDALFPRCLSLPSGRYRVEYDVGEELATLIPEKGTGMAPPSLSYLPRWPGFGIRLRRGDQIRTLRTRG